MCQMKDCFVTYYGLTLTPTCLAGGTMHAESNMIDLYESPDENVSQTDNPLFEPASEVSSMSRIAAAMEGSDVHNPMVISKIGRLSAVGQVSTASN